MVASSSSRDRFCAWPPPLREAAILVVFALMVTALSWALRADRLPLRAATTVYELELAAPVVEVADALELYDEGLHIFIDTRFATDAGAPVIPGSIPLRQASFDDDLLAVFDFVGPDDPLVLYDDGGLVLASSIAVRLADRGFTDVQILAGGLAAWRRAGGELNGQESP